MHLSGGRWHFLRGKARCAGWISGINVWGRLENGRWDVDTGDEMLEPFGKAKIERREIFRCMFVLTKGFSS